ncbi:MAG TPA: biotin/lipoyl-containing protein, partial [Burkholderiaceae bacterium]|nr:biotin/lipoyl-containing protein [Burkholderiaceae bacterium]
KVLQGGQPNEGRPGANLPPVDFAKARAEAEAAVGRAISEQELSSYLLYPKVFRDYAAHRRQYGDVSVIPTPVFFYGLKDGQETSVEIDRGKTLIIQLHGCVDLPDEGQRKLFFELNGQPRIVRTNLEGAVKASAHPVAEDGNGAHVGAPMPGMVVTVAVKPGQQVSRGDPLVSIEAMNMETMLRAERDAVVRHVHVAPGKVVGAKDLLIEFAD